MALDTPPTRAFSWRAIGLGLLASASVAALVPLNDWHYHNSYLYGQHMPIIATAFAALMGLVNPLLGRRRFSLGECTLILAMVLVVGGVAGTGLMRQWPAIVAGPAKLFSTRSDLAPLIQTDAPSIASTSLFLGMPPTGAPDVNDPAYRQIVDGFHHGSANGVSGIPWAAWIGSALAWTPLLLALLAIGVGVAGMVRQQWIHHERLTYPLATVLENLLRNRTDRDVPLTSNRWFRIGVMVAVLVLGSQALHAWGCSPLFIPTSVDLRGLFSEEVLAKTYSHNLLEFATCYIGVAAIAFMLPAEVSFSLWFGVIATNLVCYGSHVAGMPVSSTTFSRAGMGGFLMQAVVILWIGRVHYGRALRIACGARSDDPALRLAAFHVRLLLTGSAVLLVVLCVLGARPDHAALLVLISIGLLLVIARLVAEGGIPLINIPVLPNELLYSLTGVVAPPRTLFPLAMVWMITDGREHLTPYVVTADRLADGAGLSARRWTWLLAAAVVVGGIAAGISMLLLAYGDSGMTAMDGWWRVPLSESLRPLADPPSTTTANHGWLGSAIGGAVFTGLLAWARFALSWWPLHPLGYLTSMTYAGMVLWPSFALGWLGKVLVNRYGGTALYRDLRPCVIGLIVGEAGVVMLNLLVRLVIYSTGGTAPSSPSLVPL